MHHGAESCGKSQTQNKGSVAGVTLAPIVDRLLLHTLAVAHHATTMKMIMPTCFIPKASFKCPHAAAAVLQAVAPAIVRPPQLMSVAHSSLVTRRVMCAVPGSITALFSVLFGIVPFGLAQMEPRELVPCRLLVTSSNY